MNYSEITDEFCVWSFRCIINGKCERKFFFYRYINCFSCCYHRCFYS
uniref:Uncharacterized protein n=1 Tax=Bacillus subtilis TaxID=1423 RepID=Q9X3Z3_BACIU|nr:unknown [Bacillus subtilis]